MAQNDNPPPPRLVPLSEIRPQEWKRSADRSLSAKRDERPPVTFDSAL